MTRAPSAKARTAAATKAAPRPAAIEAAPEAIEGKIVTEPFIVFRGQNMFVQAPDEAQFAILIEAERWLGNVQKKRAALGVADDAGPDDPRHAEAAKLFNISKNHLARIMSVIGSLFLDQDDWDFIRDGLATREISRVELFEIPSMVIKATQDADELKPVNREAKRKAQRAR